MFHGQVDKAGVIHWRDAFDQFASHAAGIHVGLQGIDLERGAGLTNAGLCGASCR